MNKILWTNLTDAQIDWLKEILMNNLADLVTDSKHDKISIMNHKEAKSLLKRVKKL